MIFREPKIDDALHKHHTAHIIFLSKEGATNYFEAFTIEGFVDVTEMFLKSEADIEVNELLETLNKQNNIFNINAFYHYFIKNKKKEYMGVTWPFYFLFQKLLPQIKTKFIIIGHKRKLGDYHAFGGNPYDTMLASDFIDILVYPVYQEMKLFSQDLTTFNRFVSYVQETGEVPDKYNFSIIQYMQQSGDNIDRVDYP
jgi:hypothetical protein